MVFFGNMTGVPAGFTVGAAKVRAFLDDDNDHRVDGSSRRGRMPRRPRIPLDCGLDHFDADTLTKIRYEIDRSAMQVKRQLVTFDRRPVQFEYFWQAPTIRSPLQHSGAGMAPCL
jgi:hypothetical protein